MSQISIPYITESPNTFIRSSRWNANGVAIQNFLNGNNLDSQYNIASNGISDSSLKPITTAGKVDGSALVNLANTPTTDQFPLGAIPSITEAKMSFADNTTGDSSTSKHGFLPKLANDVTKFLSGLGTWVQITIDGLLPTQTGKSGQFLTTNGTSASWATNSFTQVGFGTWVNKSSNYGAQQAATDGFVVAYNTSSVGTDYIYSDGNADPTTPICYQNSTAGTLVCPVKKGQYWKYVPKNTTGLSCWWIPLGS